MALPVIGIVSTIAIVRVNAVITFSNGIFSATLLLLLLLVLLALPLPLLLLRLLLLLLLQLQSSVKVQILASCPRL